MKASRLVKTEDLVLFLGDDPEAEDAAEDTLNVKVNTGALTPNEQERIRQADDDDVRPLVEVLAAVVVEWDLLDDKGKVIPLTEAALMDQPIIVLGLVLNGITTVLAARAEEEGKT